MDPGNQALFHCLQTLISVFIRVRFLFCMWFYNGNSFAPQKGIQQWCFDRIMVTLSKPNHPWDWNSYIHFPHDNDPKCK